MLSERVDAFEYINILKYDILFCGNIDSRAWFARECTCEGPFDDFINYSNYINRYSYISN